MDESCTVYRTVDFIGKRWTLLILLELYRKRSEPKRFNELKKSLPSITQKILSERLKELEQKQMITKRIDTSTVPIRCEYSLTRNGKEFMEVIKQIKAWALKCEVGSRACQRTDCLNCEK